MHHRRPSRPSRHHRHDPPDPTQGAAVELLGVDAHRDRKLALQAVSISIRAGTVTAVIGPNGAGKSTMLALIGGRLRPSSGSVTTSGAVADVMQATTIDPLLRLTVDDVVAMGRYPIRGLVRPLRAADRTVCDEALDRMGLLELRRRSIGELSGGQRQRALIAQGLAQQASVLVLDEPAAGLDPHSQQRIRQVMRAEAEAGRTVLFATHDLTEADTADTVVVLSCRCVCCAPPASALRDPQVVALFSS